MNRNRFLGWFLPLSLFFLNIPAVFAADRLDIIQQKLNCAAAAQDQNIEWEAVCYSDDYTKPLTSRDELIERELLKKEAVMEMQEERQGINYDQNFETEIPVQAEEPETISAPEDSEEFYDMRDSNLDPTKPHYVFEIAPETYYYKYHENLPVTTSGYKGGLVTSVTYHQLDNEPVSSWKELIKGLNMYRLEGRFSYGQVKYVGSGTHDGIPDYNLEGRALAGSDIPFGANRLTPFFGFGYRYLFNQLSEIPAQTVDGQDYYSGYDRESHYLYVPLGLEAKIVLTKSWFFVLKGEWDFFLWGKQVSQFEDMEDDTGTNAGFDNMENEQKAGSGWRASARLTKQTDRLDIFIEPFVRYWHIDDSEFTFITNGGGLLCQGNLCQGGVEPNNRTWEYGLSAGAAF